MFKRMRIQEAATITRSRLIVKTTTPPEIDFNERNIFIAQSLSPNKYGRLDFSNRRMP